MSLQKHVAPGCWVWEELAGQETGEVASALRAQLWLQEVEAGSPALRRWTGPWLRTLKTLSQGKRAPVTLGFPADPCVSSFPRTS